MSAVKFPQPRYHIGQVVEFMMGEGARRRAFEGKIIAVEVRDFGWNDTPHVGYTICRGMKRNNSAADRDIVRVLRDEGRPDRFGGAL